MVGVNDVRGRIIAVLSKQNFKWFMILIKKIFHYKAKELLRNAQQIYIKMTTMPYNCYLNYAHDKVIE